MRLLIVIALLLVVACAPDPPPVLHVYHVITVDGGEFRVEKNWWHTTMDGYSCFGNLNDGDKMICWKTDQIRSVEVVK